LSTSRGRRTISPMPMREPAVAFRMALAVPGLVKVDSKVEA
jgi:hypothetical protein